MKKGFTLVELSIVLVVIGILMGLAIKGKSLVTAAQVRKDMSKIQNVSTAIGQFYSKYGMLPGKLLTSNRYTDKGIYDDILNEGAITADGFELASFKSKIHFTGCIPSGAGATQTWTLAPITPKNNICVIFSPDAHTDTDITGNQTQIPTLQACFVESSLDDSNIFAGNGRAIANTTNTEDFTNCSKLKNSAGKPGYLFRIY